MAIQNAVAAVERVDGAVKASFIRATSMLYRLCVLFAGAALLLTLLMPPLLSAGETFYTVEHARLVALGDGTHELEFERRVPREHRWNRTASASVAEELEWFEFCWEVDHHTTREMLTFLLSYCAEQGAARVVPALREPLRTLVRDYHELLLELKALLASEP